MTRETSQPLSDVRVLDLGQIYQGPYAGLLLSYLGAEVIKIEPLTGETARARSDTGDTPEVELLNPTKQGMTLDLKTHEGKEILKDLVAESDVLLENFSVGKMTELGVGYETLIEVNPQLVYGHGSGYGDDGPYTGYPAMDLTIQAIGGLMHTTGFQDTQPVKAGPAVCDFLGGTHLVAGIVSALYKRERTGEGQYVEIGMLDCLYPTLASPVSAWTKEIDAPPRTGNRHSGLAIAPYNVYEVEDGYVAVNCTTSRQWQSLVEVMDRPELLEDERFDTKASRARHIDEVDEVVQEWLDGRQKHETIDRLLDNHIPCAPVQTIEEILSDPQLRHRNMVNFLPHRGEGKSEVPVPGMPVKFSESPEPEVTPAPRLGEDTETVLQNVLDYSHDEIEALRTREVI